MLTRKMAQPPVNYGSDKMVLTKAHHFIIGWPDATLSHIIGNGNRGSFNNNYIDFTAHNMNFMLTIYT